MLFAQSILQAATRLLVAVLLALVSGLSVVSLSVASLVERELARLSALSLVASVVLSSGIRMVAPRTVGRTPVGSAKRSAPRSRGTVVAMVR